ncbi:DUF11 domain-containing protein [Micromonospora phytophila]|uniref:COG1361 S-layer family protein n=1 Tax=Micromonospora phytophila TaxID=709888 RepID=UPI0020304039|nr:DUF11 domain-containing protein [Micromonospora phytophila]MCM0675531.1 DUF11 domain-containing protein [Micromonospora phytophila]
MTRRRMLAAQAAMLLVTSLTVLIAPNPSNAAPLRPPEPATTKHVGVVDPVRAGVSKPVRSMARAKTGNKATVATTDTATVQSDVDGKADPAIQADDGPVNDDLKPTITPFAGQTGGTPPDTVGDVGPNHYVQMVNTTFQIWNKDGTSPAGGGPFPINSLWTSNTVNDNGCDTQNAGDPIVLYDQTVDRWMLAQFTSPNTAPFDMCIAYSQTPDPTGAFFTYSFRLSASHDYEKFGVWPDGLYMSTFEGSTLGAYAFDRAAMVSGSPATFQYFGAGAGALGPGVSSAGRVRMFPSDFDGVNAPLAGEPNHFLLSRDADNGQGGAQDSIDVYDFHVDWTTPANSTFGLATTLNTQPFDINVGCTDVDGNGAARDCISQPGTTQQIDALPGRLLHRVQYRNFGSYQAMVAVQSSVDADGNDRVGTRWYEMRNSGGGWAIHQQGTYAPGTADRWMGSIAMDGKGNMALGYSIVDAANNVFPSIAYTGRLAGAPLGSMPEPEQTMFSGTTSQTNADRWGDYSSMNVDPVDDCTFWYTQQHGGGRQTRIGAFKFTSCDQTDLRITKSDSPDPVYAGQQVSYTVTVTNDGPNTASSVTVTDKLPAGVTFLSSAPACTNAAGTLTCALGDLLAGQSVPLVIQVGIPANFPSGTITNTATVAADQFDPTPGNNTATATTTVRSRADLAVTKVCKPDKPAPAGAPAYCDIHVDNLGPSDATSVELTDVLTSATPFEVVSVTATPSGACAPTGSGPVTAITITCDLGTEPAGGRTTVRVTVTADDVAQVNDVATVTSATEDPNPANNQATGRVEFVGSADLSLDKTGPAAVTAGTQMQYVITVTNDGPSVARDVVVGDVLPAGVSFVSVTPSVGTCTNGQPTARDVRCGLGNLASGASATIMIVALVAPDVVPGTVLFNEAVVSSATADPDNDDVRDSVATTVNAVADLSVVKGDSPDPVLAGQKITYTIAVSNAGPSTAQNVSVTDTLPAGTSYVSGVDGNGVTVCTLVQSDKVVCALGALNPGQTRTVFLTVLVAPSVPDGTTLTNSVTVSATTPDPNAGNNTANQQTTVRTSAELWLDKTGDQRSGNPAPTVVYTLTVHNNGGCETDAQSTPTPTCGAGGPSDAQNVTVVDKLPLDPKKLVVQYVSPQCTYVKATHTVTCTAATVPAGATVTFVIEAQAQGSVRTIQNSATLTSSTPDPVAGNNTDDVTIVVKGGTGR